MHAVPPPMTGNYMPSGPDIEVDYSQFTYGPKQTQPSESESQTSEFDTCDSNISTEPSELVSEPVVNESNVECQPKVWSDAPIIEEYESDSEDEYVSIPTKEQETPSFANQQVKTPRETIKNQFTHSQKPKVDKKELGYGFTVRACFVCGSLNHLIRDCDFHEKRMARKAELNYGWNNVQRVNKQNQFVPAAVLTRTGKIPVNTARTSGTKNVSTARQSFNRQAVLTSTAMKVNTVKPIVNRVRPANVFNKTHSPYSRPFKKTTVLSTNFSKQKVNTAKVNAVSAVGGKRETAVKPSAGCNWRPQRYNWHNDYPHRALKNKGIVDSGCSRHMTGNKAYLAEFQDFNGGPVAFGGSKGYITGKEFKNKDVIEFCGSKGIKREYSNARTPQQNGVAERKNMTLIEAARTMLADSFLPNTFWAEAVSTACYVLNRVLVTKPHNKTPYELLTGQQEANHNAGTEDIIDAGDSEKEDESAQDCFVLPIWSSYSSTITPDLKTDEKREGPREEEQVFLDDILPFLVPVSTPSLKLAVLTYFNTVTPQVSTASPHDGLSLSDPTNPEQDDSEIHPIEDIYQHSTDGIFTHSSYDDEGAVADFTNLETIVNQEELLAVQDTESLDTCRYAFLGRRLLAQTLIIEIRKDDKRSCCQNNQGKCSGTKAIGRSMIGSLMYLTASRPDIMFAVCACSRFQVTPKSSHLSVVKRIFRYLKGKPKLGLWYPRVSSFDLESYSDSDYAGANLDRKSTTGGCQFLGRRLISWQCKKQTIVATSTTEAEYVAAASCCGQVLWIQNQMLDYGFNFMNTKIYIDNESTICIVKNPVYHSKTKHIAIRHHFIRDAYEKKLIQVLKIHTDDNVADLLTKAFDVSRFQFLVVSIGMINP
ncbi:putative ribonuclease H-like domain-containing protein [Tanacetum coccineum]